MKQSFILLCIGTASLVSANIEVTQYMESLYHKAAEQNTNFKGFDATRGKAIFHSKQIGKRGKEISCTSCHGNNLTQNGENIVTGKRIDPLAPSSNSKRLTRVKEIKKWLRRNFKDVYNRQGTALEKGDVLTYINSKQ